MNLGAGLLKPDRPFPSLPSVNPLLLPPSTSEESRSDVDETVDGERAEAYERDETIDGEAGISGVPRPSRILGSFSSV
jgi:hypothetical protein